MYASSHYSDRPAFQTGLKSKSLLGILFIGTAASAIVAVVFSSKLAKILFWLALFVTLIVLIIKSGSTIVAKLILFIENQRLKSKHVLPLIHSLLFRLHGPQLKRAITFLLLANITFMGPILFVQSFEVAINANMLYTLGAPITLSSKAYNASLAEQLGQRLISSTLLAQVDCSFRKALII
jgi:hypothetical protein